MSIAGMSRFQKGMVLLKVTWMLLGKIIVAQGMLFVAWLASGFAACCRGLNEILVGLRVR